MFFLFTLISQIWDLLFQFTNLLYCTITYIVNPTNIIRFMLYLARKCMLYSFFSVVAITILIQYYRDSIPNMEQNVTMRFKRLDDTPIYYGFAFDPHYKSILCERDNPIVLEFSKQTLVFDKQIICNVVVYEEDNELQFEKEFYEVWLRVRIQEQDSGKKLKHLNVKSYLVYDDTRMNLVHTTYLKLGDFYYLKFFRALPIKMLVSLMGKLFQFLELDDYINQEGEAQIFSNIPINDNEIDSKIKMLVITMEAAKDIEVQGELSLCPQLKGFRYFIYFYFWSSLMFGTSVLVTIFILLWEVLLNIKIWKFLFECLKKSAMFWK